MDQGGDIDRYVCAGRCCKTGPGEGFQAMKAALVTFFYIIFQKLGLGAEVAL
jgi:hypothetical protein